jgi:lysozyme family protein
MASFQLYIPLLNAAEGGYQNLVGDSGNYNSLGQRVGTNHGISAKTYENWINRPPSVSDMKNMSKAEALQIYKLWYWNKLGADYIENQSIADVLVDHGVNAGTGTAGKMIQRILNQYFNYNLVVDGVVGTQTRNAINSVNDAQLHNLIKDERKQFYQNLGGEFLTSWLNRLKLFVFSEKKKCCSECGRLLA